MPPEPYKQIAVHDTRDPECLAIFTRPLIEEDTVIITAAREFHLDSGTLKTIDLILDYSPGKENHRMTPLEYLYCRQLWQLFFENTFDESHGVALVFELLHLHASRITHHTP